MDLGLFKLLSKDDKPKTASALAEAAGANTKLVCTSLKTSALGLPSRADIEQLAS